MNSSLIFYRRFVAALCLLGCVLYAGCDSAKSDLVPVKGKLTVGGQPFDPQTQEEVMVILYPDTSEGGTTYPAVFADDGSFTVPGEEQQGVPPGKYRISFERMPNSEKKPVNVPKQLQGRSSVFEREITSETGDLGTIDALQVPSG